MSTVTWKTSSSRNSSLVHAFYRPEMHMSMCGTVYFWYSKHKWITDENILKNRRMCKKCVKMAGETPIWGSMIARGSSQDGRSDTNGVS